MNWEDMPGSDRGLRLPARACYSSGTGESVLGVKLSTYVLTSYVSSFVFKFESESEAGCCNTRTVP
jgi:hypothetical protein